MSSLTTRDVDTWLTGLAVASQTRVNYRRAIHNLFSFAMTRGYCASNPVTKATQPKVTPGEIGILTVPQAQALLVACSPKILSAVAIGLFAGLRASEIGRLDWSDIDLERGFIDVGASKTKTARRRLVEIPENLSSWLAPHHRGEGPVRPPSITYRRQFTKALVASGIKEWPDNALRHSFASYHLAASQNAAATALQLGHTESRTLFAHYRELVRPAEPKHIWQIRPDGKRGSFPQDSVSFSVKRFRAYENRPDTERGSQTRSNALNSRRSHDQRRSFALQTATQTRPAAFGADARAIVPRGVYGRPRGVLFAIRGRPALS